MCETAGKLNFGSISLPKQLLQNSESSQKKDPQLMQTGVSKYCFNVSNSIAEQKLHNPCCCRSSCIIDCDTESG